MLLAVVGWLTFLVYWRDGDAARIWLTSVGKVNEFDEFPIRDDENDNILRVVRSDYGGREYWQETSI